MFDEKTLDTKNLPGNPIRARSDFVRRVPIKQISDAFQLAKVDSQITLRLLEFCLDQGRASAASSS